MGMIQEQQSRQWSDLRREVNQLAFRPSVAEPGMESGRSRKLDHRCSSPPDLSGMEWITKATQSPSIAPVRPTTESDTVICAAISKPPIFNAGRFEGYKKSIRWWVEMHSGIADNKLLADLGLRDTIPAKMVLCDYFQKTAKTLDLKQWKGF